MSILYSQDNNGTVIFRPYPSVNEIFVKVLDSVYSSPKVTLSSGTYDIRLWSPNRVGIDTSIQIFSDSVTYFKEYFPPTDTYSAYKRTLKKYRIKVLLPKITTLSISSTLIFNSIRSYIKSRNQWSRVENAFNAYQFASPHEVIEREQMLNIAKDNYNTIKNDFVKSSIISGASIAISSFIFYKLRKNKKPILIAEEPPFKISINSSQNNNLSIGLVLNL